MKTMQEKETWRLREDGGRQCLFHFYQVCSILVKGRFILFLLDLKVTKHSAPYLGQILTEYR